VQAAQVTPQKGLLPPTSFYSSCSWSPLLVPTAGDASLGALRPGLPLGSSWTHWRWLVTLPPDDRPAVPERPLMWASPFQFPDCSCLVCSQGGFPARRLDPWPALKLPGLPSPSAPPAAPIRDLLRRYLRYFLPYSAPAMLAPPPPTTIFRTLSRAASGTPESNTPQVDGRGLLHTTRSLILQFTGTVVARCEKLKVCRWAASLSAAVSQHLGLARCTTAPTELATYLSVVRTAREQLLVHLVCVRSSQGCRDAGAVLLLLPLRACPGLQHHL
jgi:hypothetical protein